MDAFIEAFKAQTDLDLTPNKIGVSALSIGRDGVSQVIMLEWTDKSVHLYLSLGPSDTFVADRASSLLDANLFGQGTFGGVIATDPILKEAFLFHTIPFEALEVSYFLKRVAALLEGYKKWTQPTEESSSTLEQHEEGFMKI